MRRTLWHRIIPINRINIKSCSSHNKREFSSNQNIIYYLFWIIFPFSSSIGLIWIYNINLMMRYLRSNFWRNFIRSNIHFSKNLSGIRRNNFHREKLRQLYWKSTFSGSSSSPNNNNSVRIILLKRIYRLLCIFKNWWKIHNNNTRLLKFTH